MAVTKIRVWFRELHIIKEGNFWGAAEWYLHAKVDDTLVGDSKNGFEVRSGDSKILPAAKWSHLYDVSGKRTGSTVVIRFWVEEKKDKFSNDNLGEVKWILAYPYENELYDEQRWSPLRPGGSFSHPYNCYRMSLRVTIEEEFDYASTDSTGPKRIPATRTRASGLTLTTVKGTPFVPRLEICPVIPVPGGNAYMPPRNNPSLPKELASGKVTAVAKVAKAPSAPVLNSLVNPSVIPILSRVDPDINKKAARLALTYYKPHNLDVNKFFWKVAQGPAEIIGKNTGTSIMVVGKTGNATDTTAIFEVLWEKDKKPPLLAHYRAWVGKLGTLRYRVNLLNGTVPAYNVANLMPSATVHEIMQVVKAILYQAGIRLVPDADTTPYEEATLFPPGNKNGIYQVTVTNNIHTKNVDLDRISRPTRYNFRPGVINIAIVHSTIGGSAAAVDRNGIAGTADTMKKVKKGKTWIRVYKYDGIGSTKDDDKANLSPSSSWIRPSGYLNDAKGILKKMKTIQPTDRVNQAKTEDQAFVSARNPPPVAKGPPSFTAGDMGRLYACVVPAQWNLGVWTHKRYVWNCGINIAHEICHVLGLAHRGSGGNPHPPLSADDMNCKNKKGVMKGHPWNENLMSYGYVMATPKAHDIDLIQASVVRRHPAIRY